MEDAAGNRQYPELVGQPLRWELKFTFPQKHITEFIVLEDRMSPVAVEKLGFVGKNIKNRECFSQATQFTVLRYSSIGTLVQFPLTTFQLLTTTLLPF